MKTTGKILGIGLAVALLAMAVVVWVGKIRMLRDDTPGYESYSAKVERWRADAGAEMLKSCTNDVVGFQRLIESHLDTSGDNLKAWHGEVTADFVNTVGGIERTNVRYQFDAMLGEFGCIKSNE